MTDLINKHNYVSREFLQQEKERLWPNIWQVACREEEVPNAGDYVTYDIADDTIIIVRSSDGILRAFHNVCRHRGRQLIEGCGRAQVFRCPYHGWSYDLEGNNVLVQDEEDYGGALNKQDLKLLEVKLDTWGGFIFINMTPDCEPLRDYLDPLPDYLDAFEFEKMRYRWYVSTVMPANWKVALEAFMEGYHVAATHPQLLAVAGDDRTQSKTLGKHSHYGFWEATRPLGQPSPRLKDAACDDPREGVMNFFQIMEDQLAAIFTDRDCEAAQTLKEHAPADIDPAMAFGAAVELGRAAAEADGAGYPENLSFDKFFETGADLHLFPNMVVLPYFDGALWYRARPNGDDPDTCLYDIWSLKRYAPGDEPPLERREVDVLGGEGVCEILDQDIANMSRVQRGMKSRAFKAARPNPVQEVMVSHFHKTLESYLKA